MLPFLLMEQHSQLFTAIKQHALLTRDNCAVTLRKTNGEQNNWLLDMRRLFLRADGLDLAVKAFWDEMEHRLPFQVGGLELGAVPFVAGILAEGTKRGHNITGFIGRKSRKKSGACQMVEGEVTDLPIVLVDDLINSGNSMRKLFLTLEEIDKRPREIFVLVDFQKQRTHEWLEEIGVNLHSIFCLDDLGLASGKEKVFFPAKDTLEIVWQFTPPNPNYVFICPRSTPALDENHAFYGADNGCFYAVDLEDGEMMGERKTGGSKKGIFSSPAISGNKVIFGAYDGSVYCLDKNNGDLLWRYDAADWVGSSPAIAEDLGLVFIGLEHAVLGKRGSIVALDLEIGACHWEFIVKQLLHGTPAYCQELGLVGIGTNDSLFLLLDARSGELKWQFEADGPIKASAVFDLDRQQVVFGCHDWGCYGVDIATGNQNFCFKAENVIYNTPLIVGGKLYIGSTDKNLYVYDLDKNELITKVPTTGRIFSHPALINGHIWFGSNDGCIRKIDPETNALVGGIHLTERVLTEIKYSPKTELYYAVTAGNQLLALRETVEQPIGN